MSAVRWTVELDGRRHEVLLRHGYFSARRQLAVDGRQILDVRPGPITAVRLWNTATEHVFDIDGHSCAVRVDPTIDNMTYRKSLIVDGVDVETGARMAPLPPGASGAREGRWMAGYGGLGGFVLTLAGAIVVVTVARMLLEGLVLRR